MLITEIFSALKESDIEQSKSINVFSAQLTSLSLEILNKLKFHARSLNRAGTQFVYSLVNSTDISERNVNQRGNGCFTALLHKS